MNKKRGVAFFVISIILFFAGSGIITGNVVGNGLVNFSILQILGIGFFVGALAVFATGKNGLEYLVIPTGWENPRIEKAKEELGKKNFDKVIITGNAPGWQHRNKIYHAVRKYGVPREKIKILEGIDSEEDILYLGKILKSGDTIHFDTFPAHYEKYKQLIRKAKKDNLFPEGVNVEISKIKSGKKELAYYLNTVEELLKTRKLDYKRNREPDKIDNFKSWIKHKWKSGYNSKN